jgi:hypothetical protein
MSFAQVSDDIHLFWKSSRHVASRNEDLMNPPSTRAIIFIYIAVRHCSSMTFVQRIKLTSRISYLNSVKPKLVTLILVP